MMTSEVKRILTEILVALVTEYQRARAAVTDDITKTFMSVRRIDFS
jgi:hypothetical protein